jgi:glucan biosynthesis protein C
MDPSPTIKMQRDRSLDAARALLLTLGLVLHTGNIYTPGSTWLVHDSSTNIVFGWLTDFIHEFRMPGFFWLAGYFSALTMLKVGYGRTMKDRVLRLGVPLLSVWFLVNPIQLFLVDSTQTAEQTLRTGGLPPLFHLWFLADLLLIVPTVGLVHLAVRRWPKVFARASQLGPIQFLLLLTLLSVASSLLARTSRVAYVDLGGVTTLYRLSEALPYFAVGAMMQFSNPLRQRLLEVPLHVHGLGLLLAVLLILPMPALGPVPGEVQNALRIFVAWALISTVLRICTTFFKKRSPIVDSLVDASYTIYLFHHIIVVGLGYWLLGWNAPALLKFATVCLTTLAITWGIHRLFISRSRLLRFLLNGRKGPVPKSLARLSVSES